MMEPKRFAVIGTGSWGSLHARVYDESDRACLAAICDTNKKRADEVGQRFGVDSYEDYKQMLAREDIDAVSVVTPDFAHTAIVMDAIAAGKHILVEKPLATTTAECRQIVDAARKAGVKLMVDFHNRWSPPFFRAKMAIEKGEVGKVRMVYYRLNDTIYVPTEMLPWASRSTVQWFIGSHSLDTVTWLLNDDIEYVYSVSRRNVLKERGIDTPDFYQSTLEFKSGAVAVVENCWILPTSTPNIIDLKCEIVGDAGSFYIDGSHHRMLEKYTDGAGVYPDVLVLPEIQGKQMGFAAESIKHFIDCVVEDREPIAAGEDGLKITRLIEAIEESIATGKRVAV